MSSALDKKAEATRKARDRYHSDPEHRAAKIAAARAYDARMLVEDPERFRSLRAASRRRAVERDPNIRKRDRDAARARAKEFVRAIKIANPCMDCGEHFLAPCMDFDHVSGEKEACIGTMVSKGMAVTTIKAEIAKCELVCANCHRIRTHTRLLEDGFDIEEVL